MTNDIKWYKDFSGLGWCIIYAVIITLSALSAICYFVDPITFNSEPIETINGKVIEVSYLYTGTPKTIITFESGQIIILSRLQELHLNQNITIKVYKRNDYRSASMYELIMENDEIRQVSR